MIPEKPRDFPPAPAAAPEVHGGVEPQVPERSFPAGGAPTGTLFDQVRQMHATEKFRLALKADRTTRAILLTDNDPRTLFFLCQNPHVTVEEILRISKDTRILPNAVGYIVRNAQWMAREDVKYALVMNPKTPIPTALRLLRLLDRPTLRRIAKSQAVRPRIKTAALKRVIESPE